jgi:hypothetical protein
MKLDSCLKKLKSALLSTYLLLLLLNYVYCFSKKNNIQSTLGWTAVSTIILSFIIWNLSRTQDSFWCDPHSLIQGHSLWHILDAVAVYFLFKYYISEQDERYESLSFIYFFNDSICNAFF